MWVKKVLRFRSILWLETYGLSIAVDKAECRGQELLNGLVALPNNVAFELVPQVVWDTHLLRVIPPRPCPAAGEGAGGRLTARPAGPAQAACPAQAVCRRARPPPAGLYTKMARSCW